MCAVYAFARRVDDIGDGELLPRRSCAASTASARAGARTRRHRPRRRRDDRARGRRTPLPAARHALLALIDGVRMDVNGSRYETIEELVLYCRRVAGAIGRAVPGDLRAARFRRRTERASVLADDLGVALQLTNILRDLREDARPGASTCPPRTCGASG